MEKSLPPIPAKRYFTIGEVSDLCCVKPYVLRYWEQEFTQLKPMKRRGNRRYYQHHEVLLVRRIRELLYDQGFTISGARNRLIDPALQATADSAHMLDDGAVIDERDGHDEDDSIRLKSPVVAETSAQVNVDRREKPIDTSLLSTAQLRLELISIQALLGG
jgi:DNA-binding transcriptional MerR regulator